MPIEIKEHWFSDSVQPGDEMMTNQGFNALARIDHRLMAGGLKPSRITSATRFKDEQVPGVHQFEIVIEAEFDKEMRQPRPPFWKWYFDNRHTFAEWKPQQAA